MDKFTEYILDKIEKYWKEIKEEPSEKDIFEALIGELIEMLVEYQNSITGGVR
jgi:hypothetical protein